jgi:Zn-dependent protease
MDSLNQNRIKVTISFWAVAVFGAVICIDQAAAFVLLCAAVHELGHFIACFLLNINIDEFNITVFGFGITKKPVIAEHEILIAAAGPLAGLVFAAAVYHIGYHVIGTYSLILSAVNLIPIPPFDGDRILREILHPNAVSAINMIVIAVSFGFGLYTAIKYKNFTLILFSFLLMSFLFGKYRQNISAKMFRNSHRNF